MGECDHFQTYHKLVHSLAGHISDKLFYLLKGMVNIFPYTVMNHSKNCRVVLTQIWVKYGQTQLLG